MSAERDGGGRSSDGLKTSARPAAHGGGVLAGGEPYQAGVGREATEGPQRT